MTKPAIDVWPLCETAPPESGPAPVKGAPFLYYGGKQRNARHILPYLPRARVYVEPFAGAAALFFQREPSPVEVLNDLDGRIVNFYRVMQDLSLYQRLAHMLSWTPYSYAEFCRALDVLKRDDADDVMRAWAWFVAQNRGFAGKAGTPGDWGRTFQVSRGMGGRVSAWWSRVDQLDAFRRRLSRAYIDGRDALDCIRLWDSTETLFYCDPPYHMEARVDRMAAYLYEADHDFHQRLVDSLLGISGAAVLSGYAHDVYRPLEECGWHRHEFTAIASSAGRGRGSKFRGGGAAKAHARRTEVIWVSPRAMEWLERERAGAGSDLFEGGAK